MSPAEVSRRTLMIATELLRKMRSHQEIRSQILVVRCSETSDRSESDYIEIGMRLGKK
jgi:hypothetical protein